ncbi:pancreatic triacylglycerol lipase-like isoform X2 [Daktulosphaira vitifoliae]|uniref:pancreatic triacylglycerol lipase-like isoform X2 n=1 Tax=Daktulosphaira vitifoliae TaxID=58002 RepID=UPI0021A9AAE0|nr:pancreatic triacylglycerol lipase-like isoform X2 [Daktulosphaira vitifoliae]
MVYILSIIGISQGISRLLEFLPGFDSFKYCWVPPPKCPNQNITFHLYTRYTDDYVLDNSIPDTLLWAPFILNAPIKLLIHGYTGDKDYSPNMELRPVYLKYKNLNIISVDYKELVNEPCYVQAVHNVPLVGKCTTLFLKDLFRYRSDLNINDLHVVGFSLGAQVAGHIGRLTNSSLQRITGLDPASPLFDAYIISNEMLDKSDAAFVDVVHTNIAYKGKSSPLGNIDFYANNAFIQPSCGFNSSCSHVRAVEYYAESIMGKTDFLAAKCMSYLLYTFDFCSASNVSSLVRMGEHTPRTAKGIYYFTTNNQSPYAQGIEPYRDIKMKISSGLKISPSTLSLSSY